MFELFFDVVRKKVPKRYSDMHPLSNFLIIKQQKIPYPE